MKKIHFTNYKKYLTNDFTQNLRSNQSKINQIHKEHIKLKSLKNKKEKQLFNFKSYFKFYKFYYLRSLLGFSHAYSSENFEIFKKIIIDVNNHVIGWNGELIFIMIPSQNRYSNFLSYLDELFYDSAIIKFLDKNKIKVLELDKKINKEKDPTKLYDGHLNNLGNEYVYKLINNAIEK